MGDYLNFNLDDVKNALGITGDYQNDTLKPYFCEVVNFLRDSGVSDGNMTVGVVARGVADLWNYGGAEGKLSEYFYQRAAQLSYK